MSVVAEAVEEELRMGVETGQEILRHLNRIEEELRALRALLEQVGVQEAEEPVMLPMPDGSERPFRPNRPVSRETLEGIRRTAQLARKLQKLPEEERRARFFENMEKARAAHLSRNPGSPTAELLRRWKDKEFVQLYSSRTLDELNRKFVLLSRPSRAGYNQYLRKVGL